MPTDEVLEGGGVARCEAGYQLFVGGQRIMKAAGWRRPQL
jgi:hypothetical protein